MRVAGKLSLLKPYFSLLLCPAAALCAVQSVSTIVIPPVRELPPDEFRARLVAATSWSQHFHTLGECRSYPGWERGSLRALRLRAGAKGGVGRAKGCRSGRHGSTLRWALRAKQRLPRVHTRMLCGLP